MPQRLRSLMSCNQELSALFNTVQSLTELQRQFARVVPPHFAQSSQILGLKNGTLTVAMSSGALAAKLRQLAPEVVEKLQNQGCEVIGIRVKVQVSYTPFKAKPTPRLLTGTAQRELLQLSQKLGDTPLKQALERFAQKKN